MESTIAILKPKVHLKENKTKWPQKVEHLESPEVTYFSISLEIQPFQIECEMKYSDLEKSSIIRRR